MSEPKWLSRVRHDQAALADYLATEVVDFVDDCTRELVEDLAGCEVEAGLRRAAIRVETASRFRAALRGYTDYVAAQIIRSGNYDLQRLALPPLSDLAQIADKCGADRTVLVHVIARVIRSGGKLPMLGLVIGGEFVPDAATLKKWKALHDQGEPADSRP